MYHLFTTPIKIRTSWYTFLNPLPSSIAALSLSLSACKSLENDDVWNNPSGNTIIIIIIKFTVCFTCKRTDQFGSWYAKAMEGDDQTSRSQLSHQRLSINPKNQDKRRSLPHELRHYHIVHSLPQLALAPRLNDCLHCHDGCMVVLILSTRRTIGCHGVWYRW